MQCKEGKKGRTQGEVGGELRGAVKDGGKWEPRIGRRLAEKPTSLRLFFFGGQTCPNLGGSLVGLWNGWAYGIAFVGL